MSSNASNEGDGSLLARFASNALRQAVGAALFFATTLFLTRTLGVSEYARYFVNWNLAQILVALVSFGLYNDTIRRLSHGQSLRGVLTRAGAVLMLQLAVLAAGSTLLGIFLRYDALLLFLLSAAATFGTLLTAISLGVDDFQVFALGELLSNVAFLVLVALVMPSSIDVVGYLYVVATVSKGALYLARLQPRDVSTATAADGTNVDSLPLVGSGYAVYAYLHSLLQIGIFRGFVLASGFVLPIGGMEKLAVVWSFCDRSLVLVQGVNQILYPRLLRRSVSRAFRFWTNLGTVLVYLAAVVGLVFLWEALAALGFVTAAGIGQPQVFLCLALIPHIMRLLKMTECLAESRFKELFASHVLVLLAGAGVALTLAALDARSLWNPGLLISISSVAGLGAFYRPIMPRTVMEAWSRKRKAPT